MASFEFAEGVEEIFDVKIVPGVNAEHVTRGILRVIALGRPTVGLIPLVFVRAE